MKTIHAVLCVGGALLLFGACGKNDSPQDSSSASNISLVFKSTSLTTGLLRSQTSPATALAGTHCSVQVDGVTVTGVCHIPLEVSGAFNMGSLASTSGGAPVRILGGGSESGLSAVFKHGNFNLKTSPTITGDDNIQDGTGGPFNMVSLSTQYLEFGFTATATNKVYRVRTFFVNNVPSSDAGIAACGLGGGLAEADSLGTLFSGITAQKGDILVCVKSDATSTCSASDYQWVDSGGTLQATRPASPKSLLGAQLVTATTCTPGTPNPSLDWGSASLMFSLSSAVSVSASFGEGGKKTYTAGGSSGEALTFTLDVSTDGGIFIPDAVGITDLAAATETQILQNIDRITLKPIYVNNNKTTPAPGDQGGMLSATATLSVR